MAESAWIFAGFIIGIITALILLYIYLRKTTKKMWREIEEAIEKEEK